MEREKKEKGREMTVSSSKGKLGRRRKSNAFPLSVTFTAILSQT